MKVYGFFYYDLHTGERACHGFVSSPFKPNRLFYSTGVDMKNIKLGWAEMKRETHATSDKYTVSFVPKGDL